MGNNKNRYIFIGIATLVIGSIGLSVWSRNIPGKYDEVAQCLADKGVLFYGAFWCPHCSNQKKVFGNSARLLPYIECSTPDSKGTLPVCLDAGIKSYPTWVFPDDSRINGEASPETLAEKAGCALPE